MFSAPFTRPGKQSGNYINHLVKMNNILFLIEIVTCIKIYEFALFSTILGILSRNSSFVSPDLAVLILGSFFGDNTRSIIIMKLS